MSKEESIKESINLSFEFVSSLSNKLFDYISKISYLNDNYEMDNEYKEKYAFYRELLSNSIKKKDIREFVKSYKKLRMILDKVIDAIDNKRINDIEYRLVIDKVNELEILINNKISEYNNYVISYDNLKRGLFSRNKEKERFDLISL